MKKKITKFCEISFHTVPVQGGGAACAEVKARLWEQAPGMYPIACPVKTVNIGEVEKRCTQYWEEVDRRIKDGALNDHDPSSMDAFVDWLKTAGGKVATLLFEEEALRRIWQHKTEADVLVLLTDILWVPWEALFFRDYSGGRFLADDCVITRYPEVLQRSTELPDTRELPAARLICLDPELDKELAETGKRASELFLEDGEEVYMTRLIGELTTTASRARVIQWICEHREEQGLRLSSEVYFTEDDADFHRFPSSAALFMISCNAGRSSPQTQGFAARVAAASHCTVVAPSSLVVADAGVDFVRRINRCIRTEGLTKLSDVWAALRGPLGGKRGQDCDAITAERCYTLWYAIYGNSDIELATD